MDDIFNPGPKLGSYDFILNQFTDIKIYNEKEIEFHKIMLEWFKTHYLTKKVHTYFRDVVKVIDDSKYKIIKLSHILKNPVPNIVIITFYFKFSDDNENRIYCLYYSIITGNVRIIMPKLYDSNPYIDTLDTHYADLIINKKLYYIKII